MKQIFKISSILAIASLFSGCSAFTIGEEEFSCAGKPELGLCKGPMEVYELTNNQNHLEHMMTAEYAKNEGEKKSNSEGNQKVIYVNSEGEDITYVYEPRSLRRQNAQDYDKANIVGIASNDTMSYSKQSHDELDDLRTFNYVPNDIAPEPLAVLEEAKAMRIYVAAWEDKSGDLNIPGFVYVELQPRRWVTGHQAQMRPSRVLPFQTIKKSKVTSQRKETMAKGIDPLSISRPQPEANK